MSYSGLILLLDQGVPRDAADLLRQAGVDCIHVGELGLSQAEDGAIVTLARQRGAVVVTLDADFHTILAVTGADGPSTIRLRLQGVGGSEAANLIASLIERFADELRRGCLITVKAKKTTCHMLPTPAGDDSRRPADACAVRIPGAGRSASRGSGRWRRRRTGSIGFCQSSSCWRCRSDCRSAACCSG